MSLFGASWLCSACGRDFCSQCHEELAESKVSLFPFESQPGLIRFQHNLSSALTSCLSSTKHEAASFIPCSRHTEADIRNAIDTMEAALQSVISPGLHVQTFVYTHDFIAESELQSNILRIPVGRLKTVEFRHYLSNRTPIVITALNDRLQLSWSPSHLIQYHGDDTCSLEDCEEKEKPTRAPLRTFLKLFMNSEVEDPQNVLPPAVWKIKVWICFLH
jgi:[histone H3]-dimethyl-L-lysine9 demethylase